jgi:Domain of unknown function (DUF4389)
MSGAAVAQMHPIGLIVDDDLKRTRITVFFRILLVIPHLLCLAIWGLVAEIAVVIAWVVALFTGRVPDGLHDFLASFLRYATRVSAYLLLLADPWPPFSSSQPYPVDARIDPAASQARLGVLFRIVLAVPAILLTYVFRIVNNIVAFLSWFYAVIFGRMNEGMRNTSAWLFRYELQTYAYVFLLTDRYPTLAGAPTV